MNKKILIIDDDIDLIISLKNELKEYEVEASFSVEEGLELLKEFNPNLVLLDIRFSGENKGLNLIKKIKKIKPDVVIIMISAFSDVDNVVRSIKAGAEDFIEKPFKMFLVRKKIAEIFNKIEMKKEISMKNYGYDVDFIVKSPEMKKVINKAIKVAQMDMPVLITGETGTGKGMLASFIHVNSPRRDKEFVKISCTDIPEELFESELFGYRKGAFTGAHKDKKGLLEKGEGGTVFLDEIGDLKLSVQPKLLKLVEEKIFTRLGDTKVLSLDFRLISATNRDLTFLIKEGKFREDLYYRIAQSIIHIPPLRKRRDDILPLIDYYTEYNARKYGLYKKTFTEKAIEFLKSYEWRGNVRELKSFCERVYLLNKEEITVDDVKSLLHVEDEKNLIEEVLRKTGFDVNKASLILGVHRATIYRKIKKYGIKLK